MKALPGPMPGAARPANDLSGALTADSKNPGAVRLREFLGWPVEKTLEAGLYPFVIGDTLKLLIAAGVLPLAWKGLSVLRRRTGS